MFRIHLLAFSIMAVCLAGELHAQSCPELVGRWPYGPAYAVAVQGNYAYFGSGPVLIVADISNPAGPAKVGELILPDIHKGVAVAGSYVYVADSQSGLRIVDVSNPVSPSEAGFYDTPGTAYGAAVAGSYAYVADGGSGLRIINVSNPVSPSEAGFYDTPGTAYGVSIVGSYAYVADYEGGLRIIDVSNPAAPFEMGFSNVPGYAYGLAVAGSHAYLADGDYGLRIIDISNPASPTQSGFFNTPGSARSVAVAGAYAYVADGLSGLRIINVGNPASPAEVGFFDTPGAAAVVAVTGSYAYVADGPSGLRIVNVNDPAAPGETGFYDTPGSAMGVAIAGSHVYVASYSGGLRIIDVSDPAAPVEVGYYRTPGPAYAVAVTGTFAYVADGYGLRIINVSNPAAPFETGFYDTPGAARGVAVAGSHAYVAAYSAGLRIIDVSDPEAPVEVGFYLALSNVLSVAVSGSFAHVSADPYYRVIDISDPAMPSEAWGWTLPEIRGVAAAGSLSFVACGTWGVSYFGMPGALEPLQLATPGFASAVAIAGSLAYVADFGSGLRIIDFASSIPGSTAEVGFYDTPGTALDVVVAAGHAYVADFESGMEIFDVSHCCAGPPPAFNPGSPANGAGNQPFDLLLDWGDIPSATAYDLYFGTSIDPPLYRANLIASQAEVTGLPPSTTYTWYIVAHNGCGSRASQKSQFTTGAVQLNYQSHAFTDVCFAGGTGSGNGIAEAGETLNLSVTLVNPGPVAATGVQAVLSSSTPGISITRSTAAYPDIPRFGGMGLSLTSYGVSIDPSVPCDTMMQFGLQITADEGNWSDAFQIPIADGQVVLMDETFESWPPAGWQIIHYGGSCDWESTATTPRSNMTGGTGHAADADSDWCGGAMDTALRTPPIDLSQGNAFALTFNASYHNAFPGEDRFTVEISTDGGSTWSEILAWNEDHAPYGPGQSVNLDLTPYAGMHSVLIQFRYAAGGWYWWAEVDDVHIEASNACWSCIGPKEVPKGTLRMMKAGTDLIASWGSSCGVASDYFIYEGTLAALASGAYDHATKVCTDVEPYLQETFTPASADSYYLVVPVSVAGVEGDYGFGRPSGDNPAGCIIVGRQNGECP